MAGVCVLLAGISAASAAIREVPGGYATIQAAIDAAADGDTVVLAVGTYTGDGNRDIEFKGKAITVRSTNPADWDIVATTVIDCQGSVAEGHRGFDFQDWEDANSVIDGLTITGGHVTGTGGVYGGGINCAYTQEITPTVRNCIITGNTAKRGGGLYNCDGPIINCMITNNTTATWGGGGLRDCDGLIQDCIITGNYGADNGGGLFNCHGTIINCLVVDNDCTGHGGGMYECHGTIMHCTVADNENEGLYGCNGTVTNCIVWGNADGDVVASVLPTYSCFGEGTTGTGNIAGNPQFMDPNGGDYRLAVSSSCIDAGTDAGVDMDIAGLPRPFDVPGIDNNGALDEFDMGAYEADHQTVPVGTYHVDGINGDDNNSGLTHETAFATIGKGVDVAADGDTVLVWPGMYFESIDFGGKAITVASAADAAVIDGGGDVVVSGQTETPGEIGIDSEVGFGGVVFQSQEGPDSVLSHFVIQNWTAGVFCSGSSPTIQHVTVVNNDYGAMAFGGGDPEISNSIFWYNVYEDLSQCETQYSLVEDEIGPPEGAISYWPLDEHEGTTAGDWVGANDGTVYNAQWADGLIGGALSFDGDGDSVDMGDQDRLDFDADDSFSLSAWIKGDKSDAMMFAKRDVDDAWFHHEGYQFKVYEDKLLFVIEDDGERAVSIVGDSIVDDNQWHHVVAVRDAQADMIYLYVDGSADAVPVADTTTTTLATDSSFLLGDIRLYHRYFRGLMDEIAVFGKALSHEDVQEIYENGITDHLGDPLFADACNGDYHLKSQHGRYAPSLDLWVLDDVTSPCIDAGDPTVNPMAEPMPNGARINMGAYGGTPFASRSIEPWPTPADLNRDGIVNLLDLAILCDSWLWQASWYE